MSHQDLIEKTLGLFELYQKIVIILISVTNIFVAYHQLGIIYLAPKLTYSCIPAGTAVCPCKVAVFDLSKFHVTIVSHWNLVCGRRILASVMQASIQFGIMIGRIGFPFLFYRFGPRNVLIASAFFQKILSTSITWVENLSIFLGLRIVLGSFIGGTLVSGFAIITEFVAREHMDAAFVLYQIPFNLGHIFMSLYGYVFRDFRYFLFHIALCEVVLAFYWYLPPTPRWLIAHNKLERAIEVLSTAAKTNKLSTENIENVVRRYHPVLETISLNRQNYKKMFLSPSLRKCVLIMSLLWFSSSYCFFGLAQYVNQIDGDIFLNVTISAVACLFGTLVSLTLLRRVNRKILCVVLNLITTSCLLAMAFLSDWLVTLVGTIIGACCNFMLMIIVFVYCYELFPVVLTTVALQFSTAMAGLGSVVAPFILDVRAVDHWLMPVIFFIPPALACALSFVLPDTRGLEILMTIEEGERFIRHPDDHGRRSSVAAVYTATVTNYPKATDAVGDRRPATRVGDVSK